MNVKETQVCTQTGLYPKKLTILKVQFLGGIFEITCEICEIYHNHVISEPGFSFDFKLLDFNSFSQETAMPLSHLEKRIKSNDIDFRLGFVNLVREVYSEYCAHNHQNILDDIKEYDRLVKEIESLNFDAIVKGMVSLMGKYQNTEGKQHGTTEGLSE